MHSGADVPANGWIYTNLNATTKEKNLTSYIISKTNCGTSVDGADTSGMIRDAAHSYGINSITFEVERDTTPVMTAAAAEFKMILASATYLGLPGTQYHPQVTSTNPKVNATGVSLTTPVTIKFSENIQAGSNFASICIKNLSTGLITTLTSKTMSGNTLTIQQAVSRIYGNTYQVYIPPGAIEDLGENNLLTAYTYTFKTLTSTNVKPTIISTIPTHNATGVSLTTPITITFNENVAAASNYTGIFIKNLSNGQMVTSNKTITGNILTIKQTSSRFYDDLYWVYIPSGAVKDANGNSLLAAYTFNFTTIKKPILNIISTNPTNNATGVSLLAPIIIKCNENITAGASFSGIYIKNLNTGNFVHIAPGNIVGNTLTITQLSSRLSNDTYQVCIPAGAVKDLTGNSLTIAYTYTFTTI